MYENDDNTLDALVPGAKKDRQRKILDQLQQLDMDDGFVSTGHDDYEIPPPKPSDYNANNGFLPSKFIEKKSKKKHRIDVPDQSDDEWLQAMMDANDIKIKPGKKHRKDIFDDADGKKKKKKEKNKDELTDYNKEFETEAALLRNLMIDQSHFVESLQRQYDFLSSNKSSSRGVNKNLTDLISNITAGRSLTSQLVDKQISLKKTIADLSMKEKKELRGNSLADGENLADFASSYLKHMINERQRYINGGSSDIGEYNIDEMSDIVTDNLMSDDQYEERPEEVEKYLKYENDNIEVFVYVNQNDPEDYEYVALNGDGEEVIDYPLPLKNTLSLNRSTNIATDAFGQKYNIRWR